MAIELRTFASGDTDYIAKLNANSSAIKAAIDALQAQVAALSANGGGEGGGASLGLLMMALFNNADALIGPMAYQPTLVGSTATIAPGAMYRASSTAVVASLAAVNIGFGGLPAQLYYIVVDSVGQPSRSPDIVPGTAYMVEWSGTAFVGEPERIAPAFYDTDEAAASRISDAMVPPEFLDSPPTGPPFTHYATLDERLEAIEELVAGVTRKVGCTVDSTTGIKGAIQLDFAGTIVGWSVIADASCNLSVDVCRASSSAPPGAPAIPNTTTDKISASAPIALSSAQSASSAEAGVSTWDADLEQWDVLLFNVTSVSALTRATLYLRIEAA